MAKDTGMAFVDIDMRRRPHPLSRLLALLALVGLSLTVAAVLATAHSPFSCEYHRGSFNAGFSTDFDISRLDCRAAWIAESPTEHLWAVQPFVGIEWTKERQTSG